MFYNRSFCALFLIIVAAGCSNNRKLTGPAVDSITVDDFKSHMSVLASDEFMGRAPSTEGETKTIGYLKEQFRQMGLKPANGDSYFQEVSLVKLTPGDDIRFDITGGNKVISLKSFDDFIGGTAQLRDEIRFEDSEIVFAGYGINAPEYNWNDYAGIDVKGKTVLILINDPGYATGDTSLFTGKSMTYYGRWTYKYEEAVRQGAKAAVIIHETGAAAYPWEVVQNSWSGPRFYLEGNELAESDLLFQSWITNEAAGRIFESAGLDFGQLTTSASQRGFRPVEMNLKASVSLTNSAEYTKSSNVAAIWPGDERSDEYIIYMAHWDHFGVNPVFEGDTILNGAVDNATGVAALLQIAKAFTLLPERQNRSILFLAVTCEEQGLLGSAYYAKNPLVPLNKTAGVINIDALNIFGKTRDMMIIGLGISELDNYALDVLKRYNRYATADPTPEKGSYFRSDHFMFAKAGVPAIYLSKGVDDAEKGKEWGLAQQEKWTMESYHKPGDNYEPELWRFDGINEDIKIYFELGYDLSMTGDFPRWSEGSQWKPLRDKMMME